MAASRRALVGAAALLAFGAAACDALLGLGQYKDCRDVACADAGSDVFGGGDAADASDSAADASSFNEAGGDALANGTGDAGDAGDADVALSDAPGTGDDGASPLDRWARWKMPNPDASIGGDSSARLPNQMAYDAGDGGAGATVYDNVTHLVWQQDGSQRATSEADAVVQCAMLHMRLPTRIELVSLVDFTQHPTINQAAFTSTSPNYYWTSSPVAGDGALLYWTVDFASGLVRNDATGTNVRCVSGGSP